VRGFWEAVPGIASNRVEPWEGGEPPAWPGLRAGFTGSEQSQKGQVNKQGSPCRVKASWRGTVTQAQTQGSAHLHSQGGENKVAVNDLKTGLLEKGATVSLAGWVLLYPKAV